MEKALNAVRQGKSVRQAAKEFNISYSMLQRRSRGKNTGKQGGQTVLTKEQESMLDKGILDNCGIKERRFKSNLPGKEWMRRFLRDHGNVLTNRIFANIKRSRASISLEDYKKIFRKPETIN